MPDPMHNSIDRRLALRRLGAAALLHKSALPANTNIYVGNRPVEIAITAVSPQTVRLTVAPLTGGKAEPVPDDGSLVQQTWPRPGARISALAGAKTVHAAN